MTAELWHDGQHVLATHDRTLTAGFWGSLGFAIDLDGGGLRLALGGVLLRYDETPDLDPWAAPAVVDVEVTNADLLHAELYEADVMPDGDASAGELQARWSSDRDVSRLGAVGDTADGRRAFVVVDPSNNAIRCGHRR